MLSRGLVVGFAVPALLVAVCAQAVAWGELAGSSPHLALTVLLTFTLCVFLGTGVYLAGRVVA